MESSPLQVDSLRRALIANGFHPIELHTGTKIPFIKAWTTLAPRNEAVSTYPVSEALGTGIFLGAPGLLAVDIDCDDPTLAHAVESAAVEILGTAPKRYRQNSARCTLLYRMDQDRNSKKIEGSSQAVDFLTGKRQIVADGMHASGVPVLWTCDLRTLTAASLPLATPERIDYLQQTVSRILGVGARKPPSLPSSAPVEPVLVTDRERMYAREALASEVAKLERLGPGNGRNAALNAAAHSVGTLWGAGWINGQASGQALYDASVANGYVEKDGSEAAMATIKSGMEAGSKKPRGPLSDREAASVVLPSDLIVNGKRVSVSGETKAPATPRKVHVLRGCDIVEEPITWLWEGYLPKGKLVILAGDGGTGKSTLAFDLAARLTAGRAWPDGSRMKAPGNALIWSSEDDPADTIKPRLMAAEADHHRYGILQGEEGTAFDPARDLESLRAFVREEMKGYLSLLIIDPIVSAVTGDMHRSNDVRRSLQQFVDFAAEFDCCVLGITHFAKNTAGGNVSQRVIGSQAFSALARMVLVTAKEQDTNLRVFARAKSNNSVDDGGYHYTIVPVALQKDIVATRVEWHEALEGSSREILASIESDEQKDDSRSQIGAAKAFLSDALKDGPVATKDLLENAKEMHGISADTLRRAQKQLGVVANKTGFQGQWTWSWPGLPEIVNGKRFAGTGFDLVEDRQG